MKIVSAKCDFSAKELLENPIVRKHFISDVLDIPVESIKSLRIKNPFLWKRYRMQKQGILDILLEMNDSTQIDIELQIAPYAFWDRRNLFYLSKMFTAELRRGEDYRKLKQCICISILDFNLTTFPQYHSVYRLRDKNGNEFSNMLEIHIIELRKKLDGTQRVDDWIRLFNAETEEDLNMIHTKNPGLLEAIQEVKEMSLSNYMRLRYEAKLKERRDRNAREEYVRQEGISLGLDKGRALGLDEGRALGEEQKLLELVRRKLSKGQSVEEIAEVLEETPERIAELVKK